MPSHAALLAQGGHAGGRPRPALQAGIARGPRGALGPLGGRRRSRQQPLEDETGQYAGQNQPDDVWFLAGSYGRKPVLRRCLAPVGRELFLPVVNMWDVGNGGPPPVVERAFGSLTLDGVSVEPVEISTPIPFTVAGARLNGVTGRTSPFAVTVWGLWSHLPALDAGDHDLHVVGGDGEGFVVDVRYQLSVTATAANYSLW